VQNDTGDELDDSSWNGDHCDREWDTDPEGWAVLEYLPAHDASLVQRLSAERQRVGADKIDVSVAKVRQFCK
jgi:hypothetical protein